MNKLTAFLAIFLTLTLAPLQALAAPTPFKVPSDSILLKQGASTAPKAFTGDFGLGAANPSLSVDSSNQLLFNKNIFSLGDAASSIKQWIANLGLGASNPRIRYNPTGNVWQSSTDGTNFDDFGSGSGGAAGVQLLANPGFESGVANGWANTGGTFAAVTSGANLLIGKGSATFTASASGQFFQSTAYPTPNGLAGQSCAASFMYKGGDPGLTVQVIQGASTIISSYLIVASANPVSVTMPGFICPTAGTTLRLKVISSASAALIAFDQTFLGSSPLVAVSQASFYGAVKWPTAASCLWSRTSIDSFADFSADSDCTFPTGGGIEGYASAPATKIPAISFASLPPGDYAIHATGRFLDNTGGTECSWAFYDGVTTKPAGSAGSPGTATLHSSPGLMARFSYTSGQSSKTFSLQGTGNGSSSDCQIPLIDPTIELNIWVQRFPLTSELASTPGTSALSWSGYHTNTGGWATTSATFADPSAGTGVTLTQQTNRNFGTVVTEAGGLPGITWSASRTGRYYVCAGVNSLTSTTLDGGLQLVDGSNTPIDPGEYQHNVGNTNRSGGVCGIQDVSAVGPVTTKLRVAADGTNTHQIASTNVPSPGASIRWMIFNIDTPFPQAVMPGSVISSSAGVERVERITFRGASVGLVCSTDPCVIDRQSGSWVTSANRSSLGNFSITIAAGTFSTIPTCTAIADTTSAAIAGVSETSSTFVNIYGYAPGGATADGTFSVICMGPK